MSGNSDLPGSLLGSVDDGPGGQQVEDLEGGREAQVNTGSTRTGELHEVS